MTTPAIHPPVAPDNRADAIDRIRASGGRLTPAKTTVLDLLFDDSPPRTAEQIADAAHRVDRSIVYRCLRQFEELGIAAHVHMGHGQAVYRRRGLTTVPVACAGCGAVVELEGDITRELERLIGEHTAIELDLAHFPLTGRCERCRDVV